MGRALRVLTLLVFALMLGACAPEGPTAFVTYNVPPSSDCVVTPSMAGDLFLPTGTYDISPGGSSAENCRRS